MINSLQNYFLSPGSALRLGVSRCLFYACFLWQMVAYNLPEYAEIPTAFWRPVVILRAFEAPTPLIMHWAVLLLYLTAGLACLGFCTRPATWMTAFLGVYVLGVVNSYGDIRFHFSPMVIIACILPLVPCGDAFSLDRRIRKKPLSTNPADYTWPIKLSQITLIVLMFTAGCQKISGNWLQQPIENIHHWVSYKYFIQSKEKGITLPDFILDLTDHNWILFIMAATLLVAEFLCPLALNTRWPKIRFTLISLLFLMQLILTVFFKTLPSFPWLGAYFFFVPWDSLITKFKSYFLRKTGDINRLEALQNTQ